MIVFYVILPQKVTPWLLAMVKVKRPVWVKAMALRYFAFLRVSLREIIKGCHAKLRKDYTEVRKDHLNPQSKIPNHKS